MFSKLFFCGLCSLCLLSADSADREKGRSEKEPKIVLKEMDDIEGYYICKGSEGSGKNYNGIAVITKKNSVYVVTWVIGSSSTFTGIGVRQGDIFSVGWALPTGEKGFIRGVNLYRIETGPRLVGAWATLPGPGVPQRETLIFLKKIAKAEDE